MKVRDLKMILEDFDDEADVHISYNYGDYWRTEVAPCVSSVGDAMVVYSAYHDMDKVIYEDEAVDVDEVKHVVVIS